MVNISVILESYFDILQDKVEYPVDFENLHMYFDSYPYQIIVTILRLWSDYQVQRQVLNIYTCNYECIIGCACIL